ncbi:uncharacterized protein [Diadema antillarum]|uniref:uncharacterized protein n=1 Tax=Diadema antillarum TaxID=105358 RepID=UPI003A8C1C47
MEGYPTDGQGNNCCKGANDRQPMGQRRHDRATVADETIETLIGMDRLRFIVGLNVSQWLNNVNLSRFEEDLPPLGDPDDIRDLQEQNEGLPQECRLDLCKPQNVTDLKGTFEWDYTPAGEYAFLPCPNGVWLEDYLPSTPTPKMLAYRPCKPPTERTGLRKLFYEGAFWGEPETDICRWSSETTWMLDEIRKSIAEEIIDLVLVLLNFTQLGGGSSGNATAVISHLREANELLDGIPTFWLNEIDVLLVASMIDTSISAGVEGLYDIVTELGHEVVRLADRMLDLNAWVLRRAHHSCLSIADNLQIYTEHVTMGWFGEKLTHHGRNLFLEVDHTTPEYLENLPQRWMVSPDMGSGANDSKPIVSIEFPWAKIAAARRRNASSTEENDDEDTSSYAWPDMFAVPSYKLRAAAIVYYTGKFFVSELAQITPVDDAGLIYIHVYTDGVPLEETTEPLAITFYHSEDEQDEMPSLGDLACSSARLLSAHEPMPDLLNQVEIEWDSSYCTLNFTNDNYTVCMCTLLEIIGLIRDLIPTPAPTTPETPPGPLEFIGIPNSLGLTITSYIGYSISIISILMTILTYAFFPNLRRGLPTLIHVNLCVAILLLLLMLISSVAFCDTVIGCRVANIFRVYIILVSLMWNGVEAVHMYTCLVKVFTSHASHFVLKAGIIAWVVPLIIVVIPAAVNVSIFDGSHENCTFSCRLSPIAFYCLFLLPMVVIVLFNSVVFGLVLRVIRKIYAKDGKKTPLNQLKGAVALLVLLGITWIFGAAAAVNFQFVNTAEGPQAAAITFQVLFAICVAFQGFFIFIFHCARYPDVRQQWKATLTPRRCRRHKRKSSCIPTVSSLASLNMATEMRVLEPQTQETRL